MAEGGAIAPSCSHCETVESVKHFGGSPELASLFVAELDHHARVDEWLQGSVGILGRI
jgi:hypothetical protein